MTTTKVTIRLLLGPISDLVANNFKLMRTKLISSIHSSVGIENSGSAWSQKVMNSLLAFIRWLNWSNNEDL